ncbi:MAG: PAS domain S-box protein [Patescibacteria group bacterium]
MEIMKDPGLEHYKKNVQKQLKKLRPLFAKAAIGDFSTKITLPDNDDEFTELYTGIQLMTEVIHEKIATIESVNNELQLAQTTAKLGNWQWDVLANTIIWSPQLFKIFDLPVSKHNPTFDEYISLIHPEDQAEIKKIIETAFKAKKPYLLYHRVFRKNGSIRYVRGIGRVIKDRKGRVVKMIGTAQDITDEKKIQVDLENRTIELEEAYFAQKRLAAIVESSSDAITSKDLNGVITSWNRGAEKMYGYKDSEIIGKHVTFLIPPSLHKDEEYIISCIKKGQRIQHYETRRFHKSGKEIFVSLTVSPIKDTKGNIIGASAIGRDITEKKLADQQKEDFVALVSHELKTPVTSLKMFSHVLNQHFKDKNDAKGHMFATRIEEQLDRLTKLIVDLLDITRVQKGKLEYKKSQFSLKNLLTDVVTDVQATTATHKITVRTADSSKVFADKDRVRQVIINFLTNGIKYSPHANKIIVEIKKKNKELIVGVQDFGIGIDKDHQDKIFTRFYQINTPELKTYPGLGLGLYICNEIIVNQGGRLWVKSIKGKGSTFYFTLPLAE